MNAASERSFLSSMPEPLAAAALVGGEEAAWEQADCAAAIEWLRNEGYAVLGTELWLLKKGQIVTSISTIGNPVLYCTSCDLLDDESWDEYVQRSAARDAKSVATFRFPEDSLETCPAYFNLCWADRKCFQSRGKFVQA